MRQRDWKPPEKMLKASGIWLQNFHRPGETDSWRAQTKPCAHQEPGERSSVPTRDWARPACECPRVPGRGVGSSLLRGRGHWKQLWLHKSCWRRQPLPSLPPPWFGLKQNNREGTQPCPSTENWIKDLLSMAPPVRTRPSFPHSQSLPSGSFHKPLILIHQTADRMKTTITEN